MDGPAVARGQRHAGRHAGSTAPLPRRPLIPLAILGTGVALPRESLSSAALERRLGLADGTIEARHGVRRRHIATADEPASLLGARAGLAALEAAGIEPGTLDAVVSACSVMEQAIPCQAVLIQRRLGLGNSGIPSFDVNASCLSFLVALELIAASLASGRYRTVLIVSSETPSVGIDERDPTTAGLFGDGAAAIVVGAGARGGAGDEATGAALLALELATWADEADCCALPGGGTGNRLESGLEAYLAATRFRMDGRRLYRAVARRLPAFLERLCDAAGLERDALPLVVPHQASGRALGHLARLLALPRSRLVETLAEHGNQVAASLPFALHRAIADGRLSRGERVLLLGSGAGVSLGGAVLRY